MSKITLSNVQDLTQPTAAAITINTNNAIIQTEFDNTLSRDGTSPNQMENNLDMNGWQVLNLPQPLTTNSPLRLQDLNTFIGGGTISTLPAGGTTGQGLVKNSNSDFDTKWSGLVSSVGLAVPGDFTVTGSPVTTSGTLTISYANSPTGSGAFVKANTPTLVTPNLGTPASGVVTNLTGTAGININGTVGATTPNTGSFTTLAASSTVSGTGFSTYLASPPAIGGTAAAAGTFTTLSGTTSTTSPILQSSAAITFKTNGTTFAGDVTTGQQWFMGGTLNTPQTGPILTVSKNTSALPAVGTPTGVTGTTQSVLVLAAADSSPTDLQMFSFAGSPAVRYFSAQGTAGTPTATLSTNTIGANFAYGYGTSGGNAYYAGAGFVFTATNTFTSTTTGTRVDIYATPTGTTGIVVGTSIGAGLMVGTTTDPGAGVIGINNATYLIRNNTAWTNNSGSGTGTLTNAPAAGNPTKWIRVDDNGTSRFIPAW